MKALSPRALSAAIVVATIAGFVDAVAFIQLGGYFVSFMSGNTTRSAVDAAGGHLSFGVGLICAFVMGVILATVAGRSAARWRSTLVLSSVTLLLTMAALMSTLQADPVIVGLVLASAMGATNTLFARGGPSSFGLTYMTGALVKLGQTLVDAFTGGPRWLWLRYLGMWLAIAAGATGGAIVYGAVAVASLWLPAVACAALSAASATVCWTRRATWSSRLPAR